MSKGEIQTTDANNINRTFSPGADGTVLIADASQNQGMRWGTLATGVTGPTGDQGIPGITGSVGPTGAQGIQGTAGTNGAQGPTGSPLSPRVASTTTSGAPSPDASSTDLFKLTAQTVTAGFLPPSGTPVDGQRLTIQVVSSNSATARPMTWSSGAGGYQSTSPALPSTTTTGKVSNLDFQYVTSNNLNKWLLRVNSTG